jgi:hypothetical protein
MAGAPIGALGDAVALCPVEMRRRAVCVHYLHVCVCARGLAHTAEVCDAKCERWRYDLWLCEVIAPRVRIGQIVERRESHTRHALAARPRHTALHRCVV